MLWYKAFGAAVQLGPLWARSRKGKPAAVDYNPTKTIIRAFSRDDDLPMGSKRPRKCIISNGTAADSSSLPAGNLAVYTATARIEGVSSEQPVRWAAGWPIRSDSTMPTRTQQRTSRRPKRAGRPRAAALRQVQASK